MATQKKDLGIVVGTEGKAGPAGKDAKIASATATADATHSESPTVTVDVGGEAGAQTLSFTFTGLMGATGPQGTPGLQGGVGPDGPAGKDAAIASATATVTPGHLDAPTCTVVVGGEPGAQTLTFTFAGLQGATGQPGSPGKDATFSGSASQVTLGDGTPQDISTFISNNIEAIRTGLGVATTAHMGLVPQLPAA